MKKIFVISLAAVSLFASCAKQIEVVAPTGVTLDKTALTLTPGQVVELAATIAPANVTSTALTWISSNTAVATVSKDWGQVVAINPNMENIGPGKATITATTSDGKQAAKCEVVVNPISLTGVAVEKPSIEIEEREESTIKIIPTPANASYSEAKWFTFASADTTIAKVNAEGVITGVKEGTTTITATSKDGGKTATVTVNVKAPSVIDLWVSDEAGSVDFKGGDTAVDGKDGWLSYKDGKVTFTENTTGFARSDTLKMVGAMAIITQVSAKDLAGDYTFYSHSFNATGVSETKVISSTERKSETPVKIVAVESPEIINGHEYNLDIVGLYCDFKVRASFEVVENTPKFYVYLVKEFFNVDNKGVSEKIAVIPELTNTTSYSTGYFAPNTFGPDDCNYTWPAWDIKDLFTSSLKITMGDGDARKVSEDRWFCGFSFCKEGYTNYTTIYQLNYMNKWVWNDENGGAYFKKIK